MTGPEHTYMQVQWLTQWTRTYHAMVQQLSSVYNQLTLLQARLDFTWCSSYPRSSEIKLMICTAPGMTKYPNSPLSWAWSKIIEGTLILIIALTRGRLV